MDIRKIKKLITLIEQSNISEIKIRENDTLIKICKSQISTNINKNISSNFLKNNQKETVENYNIEHINHEKKLSIKKNLYLIRSPMVGIFYRAPNPKKNPFVEIGQKINIGDTVCIIEAMKMMNQIQSEYNGVIVSILLEDGQPVEFDEPLIGLQLN
ncbi:MAG: acetyl-CoA carboxylase biotin carboxyl carrier protein [Wigglesworthia glossinidia]|nr:acetyl-CoA carboxylase biotin carboxyl carrier protein [Wigglesworthia glossinidia]